MKKEVEAQARAQVCNQQQQTAPLSDPGQDSLEQEPSPAARPSSYCS